MDKQVTPFDNDREYVARQVRQYEDRQAVLQAILDEGPQEKGTAIGREMLRNSTCTCKSFGVTRKEHAIDCKVKSLMDRGEIINAEREMRLNDSYLDGLRASLKPTETADETIRLMGLLDQENKLLRARVGELEAQLRRESRAITNGHRGY